MQERYANLFKKMSDGERVCSMTIGILFLGIGIAGFLPSLLSLPAGGANASANASNLIFDDGYGYVLGLFPTNFLHNAVHIAVGVLGIAAATSFSGALVFNQGFAIIYAAIAIMGLLPFTNTTFGLMPIFGNNVWFNALTALAAGYYGFIKPTKLKDVGTSPSI